MPATSKPAQPGQIKDIEMIVLPRTSDLGDGFEVRRALPSTTRRAVGPFVFLDQMGPAVLGAGKGLDVRPHPHIGLATVTYLFEGEILHRDSLGSVQPIRPGELNWMTAGAGIVHSERTPEHLRPAGSRVSGLQAWVALPRRHEDAPPGFAHFERERMPTVQYGGLDACVIAGTFAGARSPAPVLSEMVYVDATLAAGARLPIAADWEERGVYVVQGSVEVEGDPTVHGPQRLLVLRPETDVTLRAHGGPARVMVLGGDALDGPRIIWWNFVASSRERLEQAKEDWVKNRFAPVPQETEFIPLPAEPQTNVSYP